MKKLSCLLVITGTFLLQQLHAQDTFSIVAIDSVTGEVGGAGASCVDLFNFPGYTDHFLCELFPGLGAINSQAAYVPANQLNARNRMLAGDTPAQIINWLDSNDVNGTPDIRQYGIAAFVNGSPQTAGYTGVNCMNYKNHITGPNYSIQGNILLGQQVLDSMEARFNRETGDLACKLMAALQGAKMVGADTRCTANGTSSLFAFVKVSVPTDTFGAPSFLASVRTHGTAGIEPVDTLQKIFDNMHLCPGTGIDETIFPLNSISIFPNPASEFVEIKSERQLPAGTEILVADVMGNMIFHQNTDHALRFDTRTWSNGIYAVIISNGSSVLTKKIIRQK